MGNLTTVQALIFVGSKPDRAEVLMFDRDVNTGYQIDASENFGLEPMCQIGKMPSVKDLSHKEGAKLMRRVVKESLSEAMYQEIGRILEGTLGGHSRHTG